MRDTLSTIIYDRSIESPGVRSRHFGQLYSNHSLISSLDITSELHGHTGCVNALSWSTSGKLLASGSDDQHLNIHAYQPGDSNAAFKLTTTVATGHTQNIFSVKFMPHHNDRTVITCAGDGEVRIFDLEYAGRTREASRAASIASARTRNPRHGLKFSRGIRSLNDGNTDCRVYRSHSDRVKRIVTESSPHLFLTCSEDGEVRQWDLRQTSSSYPSPDHGGDVPPALISYKRYRLDLNSISCSASQPHYIALGGAHINAFLHDRRMLGRDRVYESGKRAGNTNDNDDMMTQATQCVRKFAPGSSEKAESGDGHITAVKISDARPDEMIASWSGDHIYSFDLVRSPDAGELTGKRSGVRKGTHSGRVKNSGERKRKRDLRSTGSNTSIATGDTLRTATSNPSQSIPTHTALRVRYGNGQSEDILLPDVSTAQRRAQAIAARLTELKSSMLAAQRGSADDEQRFSPILTHAASLLPLIDDSVRSWQYALRPSPDEVRLQKALRRNRESARRFVQATGTLARVLGGKLVFDTSAEHTSNGTYAPHSSDRAAGAADVVDFLEIQIRASELEMDVTRHLFAYDFVKAILLWLESGVGRLIEGFTRPEGTSATSKTGNRLPIPAEDASSEAITEFLVPYLLGLTDGEGEILDPDANEFLTLEEKRMFSGGRTAVLAWAEAVERGFDDLASAVGTGTGHPAGQDRTAAKHFWGAKVARVLLKTVADVLNENELITAFGGQIGASDRDVDMLDAVSEEDAAHAPMTDAESSSEEEDEDSDAGSSDDEDQDDDNDTDTAANPPAPEQTALPNFLFTPHPSRRRPRPPINPSVPSTPSTRTYRGHLNTRTVKDVSFLGPDDSFVASGSDDGSVFIWDRSTSALVNILHGDDEVVNVVESHPYETMMAVSGIDCTVKIFSPDGRERRRAVFGEAVDGEAMRVSEGALTSRKRWHDREKILERNEEGRVGGGEDAFVTLPHARLLQLLFGQMAGGAGGWVQ